MPPFPRVRWRSLAAVWAALALTLATFTMQGTPASGGELRSRQRAVHRKAERAARDLDGSSARLRGATRALSHARERLSAARTELADVRKRLALARQRDAGLREALAESEARLAQAHSDVAQGERELDVQRNQVIDTVTAIYEQGDPQLLAFASILSAETVADITRQREASHSLVTRETNELDDVRAAEVLLQVHEDEARAATAEVAEKRQASADQLVEVQGLAEDALEAKDRVMRLVFDRKDAEAAASRVKHRDQRALHRLKEQERRIHKKIQEAIRKARERARRQAAAQAAWGSRHGSPSPQTGALLLRPVDGPVTSPFGYRMHPIYHYWALHDGDDFGAACGTPLMAAADGKVLSEYYSSVWGNRLYLNVGMINGSFVTVIYNHLSGYAVGTGATVHRGQTVGYVGTTGWSTGCHLHFTVLEDGHAVDPMGYF